MTRYTYGGEIPHLAAKESGAKGTSLVVDYSTEGTIWNDANGNAVTAYYLWQGSFFSGTPSTSVPVDSNGFLQRFQVDDIDTLFDAAGYALLPWERGGGGEVIGTVNWANIEDRPTYVAAGTTQAEARSAIAAASASSVSTLAIVVDNLEGTVDNKADASAVYTKAEVNNLLGEGTGNLVVLDVGAVPAPGSPTGVYLRRTEVDTEPPATSTITFVAGASSTNTGNSTSNVTVSLPTGVQTGDFAIAVWQTVTGATTYTAPAGWTGIDAQDNGLLVTRLYRRVLTAADSAGDTITFAVPGAAATPNQFANRQHLAVVVYRGAAAVEGFAKSVAGAGPVLTFPALSTSSAQARPVYVAGTRSSSATIETFTAGSGVTERVDGGNGGNGGKATFVGDGPVAATSGTAVGGKTVTVSGGSLGATTAWTLSLRATGAS